MRLKQLRTTYGLNQSEMASAFNIAQNTFSNWENGKREPDFDALQSLSDFFNVSVDYLLGRNDNEVYLIDNQGSKLKEIREDYGYSIEDVSSDTGISPKILQQYENDEISLPSNLLEKILSIWDRTIDGFNLEYIIRDPGVSSEVFDQLDGDYEKIAALGKAVDEDVQREYTEADINLKRLARATEKLRPHEREHVLEYLKIAFPEVLDDED